MLPLAQEEKLSGIVFVREIWSWEADMQKFVRVVADFKLVRIDDGAVLWQRQVQGAIPTSSATNLGQASTGAVKAILHDLFRG